ncbi:MAG: hypothetical protein LBF97_05170 [Elusimicrobiota bacterium]|jgi:hypothetical protein|nr:hypothetical protein [Elusimicrobiota bacterium]
MTDKELEIGELTDYSQQPMKWFSTFHSYYSQFVNTAWSLTSDLKAVLFGRAIHVAIGNHIY